MAVALIRVLWATYRFKVLGSEAVEKLASQDQPMILTLWHGSIFVTGRYLDQLSRSGVRVTYLISPSVDGELGVRLVNRIDGHVVRGSATRSGVKAMRGLYKAIRSHRASPVVLPDGPQGPRHSCKPGSLLLAQMSGAPVVPIAAASRPAWRAPTWDRLLVPPPFSRVVLVIGEPFEVPSGLDPETLEAERERLERLLVDLDQKAARQVRRGKTTG
jgi:lysophospholipid acyltransferase (LPLAT)-like uncharacterized protein